MNHLAHFLLAQERPYVEAGAFLGDYVKGSLRGQFPGEIEDGIRLHRKIDAFTDGHAAVKRSCRRFDPLLRRYAPIMIDIFFDHLLAINWQQYHSKSLGDFSDQVFFNLERCSPLLPEPVVEVARRMKAHNVLASYADPAFLPPVLARLGQRLKRKNPLAEGHRELEKNYRGLSEDFAVFFPQAMHFAKITLTSLSADRTAASKA
jgi:acyl carrier protein phosphodiesterase